MMTAEQDDVEIGEIGNIVSVRKYLNDMYVNV